MIPPCEYWPFHDNSTYRKDARKRQAALSCTQSFIPELSPLTNLKSATLKDMHRLSACVCGSLCVEAVFFLCKSVTKKLKISLQHNMSGLCVALWREIPSMHGNNKRAAALFCLRMTLGSCKKSLFAQRSQRRWNQQLFLLTGMWSVTEEHEKHTGKQSSPSQLNLCAIVHYSSKQTKSWKTISLH